MMQAMEVSVLIKDKVAVVYGAGGAIGGAVARAFAAEGAIVFAAGRSPAPVEAVASAIVAAGGSADAAVVDALDEEALDRHLQSVIGRAGRLDIAFNAVGIANTEIVGVPLTGLGVEQFMLPLTGYARSFFLTARLAARRMLANRSGVIMTVTALPARTGTQLNGGYGPAMAAREAMIRDLSAELAPQGIRVVGLRPHGLPETRTMRDVFAAKGAASCMSWDQFRGNLAGTAHTRRVMALEEVASLAAFMASDRASGMTGTTINLTMGSAAD